MRHGASLYDALSIQFDPHHTAELQPLLRTLKEYGYIDVTPNKMVTITTLGLQELKSKDQMYPHSMPPCSLIPSLHIMRLY